MFGKVCIIVDCTSPIYCKSVCQKHYSALHYKANKEHYIKLSAESQIRNKDQREIYRKEYYNKNKDLINAKRKAWREKTIEKRKRVVNKYLKNRRKDIKFLLAERIRTRLYLAVKGIQKPSKLKESLGCSINYLKNFLESKFEKDMSWDNYGKWHIDHIIPLSSFDLSAKQEYNKACHYTNLQPLWALDNIKKGKKL